MRTPTILSVLILALLVQAVAAYAYYDIQYFDDWFQFYEDGWTVGDKSFYCYTKYGYAQGGDPMFINDDRAWVSNQHAWVPPGGHVYGWRAMGSGSIFGIMPAGTSAGIYFQVVIVDDPSTPTVNEGELYNFTHVSGRGGNVVGNVNVNIKIRDGMGGAILLEVNNTGEEWGPLAVPGWYNDIWVQLDFDSVEETTIGYYDLFFYQTEPGSPVEPAGWSSIKALYR
ncbi:MAG: hypothetical protein JXB46_09255 [Candidatus Eisenbacteria bacterium]|nr:hypothetical protein [Candidatus Eisenbacteria bacterium]